MNYNNVKLAICVPCRDYVLSEFSFLLHKLLKHNWQQGIETEVFYNMSTLISHQREGLVLNAQKYGATHVLWLDSDMIFPADAAERLLKHQKKIVAANYMTRRPPHFSVCLQHELTEDLDLFNLDNYMEVDCTKPVNHELIEVKLIGMGCMLVDAEVYANIPRPWFEIKCFPGQNVYIGEDARFCHSAGQAGYKILVDDGLSREIKHIGLFAVGYDKKVKGNFNNKF